MKKWVEKRKWHHRLSVAVATSNDGGLVKRSWLDFIHTAHEDALIGLDIRNHIEKCLYQERLKAMT